MRKYLLVAAAGLALTVPALAQDAAADSAPSPNQIVELAPASDWIGIAPEDLLVMQLAPDADGSDRKVVIQLMPPPFSQGWVDNIRTLARDDWWNGTSINRVQDNYVVQWGDAGYDNPESGDMEQKSLPEGLTVVPERDYTAVLPYEGNAKPSAGQAQAGGAGGASQAAAARKTCLSAAGSTISTCYSETKLQFEASATYADFETFRKGWPLGSDYQQFWPIHCYGMVGVGRNYSPDTGSGAELYTVIGHAPRHLDRNIALVGRIVEGMEHLSSLPRGKGELGFYEDESKRTPILAVRLASDLPKAEQPAFEYLSTESDGFAAYADARANRRDPFFIVPAGGADICNIPVPVRRVAAD